MSPVFKRIALVGRPDDERLQEPMQALVRHLGGRDIELFSAIETAGVTTVEEDRIPDIADLIIAIGGDGTMLYAGALAQQGELPLLGINRGRLGFLADVKPEDIEASIDCVLAGNFTRESRALLKADLERDGDVVSRFAVNDVVLQRRGTGRMVDFETRVDNQHVNTHAGDGLIVATPTGSTAYALSCGGPIIDPRVDAVLLVPVAPHTLTDRPIVMPSQQPIEIVVLPREDTRAEVTVDGWSMGDIVPGDKLTIGSADRRLTLIHPPGYDYFEVLRSKLYWGQDGRNRGTPENP